MVRCSYYLAAICSINECEQIKKMGCWMRAGKTKIKIKKSNKQTNKQTNKQKNQDSRRKEGIERTITLLVRAASRKNSSGMLSSQQKESLSSSSSMSSVTYQSLGTAVEQGRVFIQKYLPTIVRFAHDSPFEDVRTAFKGLLQQLKDLV